MVYELPSQYQIWSIYLKPPRATKLAVNKELNNERLNVTLNTKMYFKQRIKITIVPKNKKPHNTPAIKAAIDRYKNLYLGNNPQKNLRIGLLHNNSNAYHENHAWEYFCNNS